MKSLSSTLLALSVLTGCAAHARPHALDELAAVRGSPQAHESAALAPAYFADAEAQRREAERFDAAGDPVAAQLAAERALAAYTRAFARARSARTEHDQATTSIALAAAERDLAVLADAQLRADAEVRDFETRTHVIRSALPVAASGPADPRRERARSDAARSLAAEAKLLCVSAHLIGANPDVAKPAETLLAELTVALDAPRGAAGPAPVDLALRARAACLAALTQSRRTARASTSDDAADTLLAELSREGSLPASRDDRGVFVTIHDAFSGDSFTPSAQARFASLADVAAAHAKMPLLVVVHPAVGEPSAASDRDQRRADRIRNALRRSDGIAVDFASPTRPLNDGKNNYDRARSNRVEVVFVDTGG